MCLVSDARETMEYRKRWLAREPAKAPSHPEELRLLSGEEGVFDFSFAPVDHWVCGRPPRSRDLEDSSNRHLWVITPERVPVILERNSSCQGGKAKHTNLTGASLAHSGGEIWFRDSRSFWLSGGSGRFPPREPEELEAVATVFRACGYAVASLGWDDDRARAVRYLRGEDIDFS
jgi:hypothetical protein